MKTIIPAVALLSLAQIHLIAQPLPADVHHWGVGPIGPHHTAFKCSKIPSNLAVVPVPGGARLRCGFQRLDATISNGGLWLASTREEDNARPFRVLARALGRDSTESLV